MRKRIVLGVHLSNRMTEAPPFQELITQYGCNIRTRIGLHDVADGYCSMAGLILLDMIGEEERINELETKLKTFEGLDVQKMVFTE